MDRGHSMSRVWLFVPLRSSDVQDWIGDTIGGTLGAAAYIANTMLSDARKKSG